MADPPVIVAGWLRVDPSARRRYLDEHRAAIEAARAAPGCLDFHLTPDPIEDDRINVFEHWESAAAVERFRGSGPDDNDQQAILEAHVDQFDIAARTSLT
jgi:quinol monooxygenase YgiN